MKKNVLIVGSGKRAQGAIIPALWCLKDDYNIAAVYSRSIKTISLFGGAFTAITINNLEGLDFAAIDLILVAIPIGEVPGVLRNLAKHKPYL